MTKRYYSVNGEILGDSSSGYYMRDALGSVTGTTSPSTGAVQNTYRYKPYGELLAKTGTSPDPRFQWVGTAGYRQTSISHSASYVRARHLGLEEGRWTTVDPLWPLEARFSYVLGRVPNAIDSTGKIPTFGPSCMGVIPRDLQVETNRCIESLCRNLTRLRKEIENCLREKGLLLPKTMECMSDWCTKGQAFWCPKCMPTFSLVCENTDKCGMKGTIDFMAPECLSNNCRSDLDPTARVTICDFWFIDFPKLCSKPMSEYCGATPNGKGSLFGGILHELVHMCGKCKAGNSHRLTYDLVAQCIEKVVKCR